MKGLPVILASVMLGAVGQLLLKKGMMAHGAVGVAKIWSQLITIFLRPPILVGIVCFVVSMVLWLVVMSKYEISYAYPMVSISYIVVLIVSALWFHEHVSVLRILGVGLICLGVAAITRT